MDNFSRTELLLGKENMDILKRSKVIIFGIGGVGSYVCESLVRCGIGSFILVDKDVISKSNINRQIHATINTVGKSKVEEMKKRMLSINSEVNVEIVEEFFLPGSNSDIMNDCDYVVDAVDTVSAKIYIIESAKKKNIPVISAMGAGNKLDPTKIEITDISKTSVCPLARVMRYELKKRNIHDVKVAYSKEKPISVEKIVEEGRVVPASISFVPSTMGLIIASSIIKDLVKLK